MTISEKLSRRTVLRGMLQGTAVTVALPLLECLVNENGTAYAATGAPLPPCFGTFFWPLGLPPDLWEPSTSGNGYVLPEVLSCLKPIQPKMNLFSGMQTFLDGKVNQNHFSGAQCQATGIVSSTGSEYYKSIDATIGDAIGRGTRFRSIEVSCDGDRKSSWSARGSNGMNPAEISPAALYVRIFGPEYKDPNAADFTPDPLVMARQSVLSAMTDERKDLMSQVSAADRSRLDEYFSSVRDLEQKLAIELERPAPLPSCTRAEAPPPAEKESLGPLLVDQVRPSQRLFTKLIAHALACGQTRVFNVSMGTALSTLRRAGDSVNYHSYTHEEPVDAKLGFQPTCRWFAEQLMDSFRELVQTLDQTRELDGTLLDRTIVYAFTDHGEARLHSMKRYPIFTAGSGGGRMRTGYHIPAEGDTVARVGLTIQRAFRVTGGSTWGSESNATSKPFSEVLV
jgi:hypothetical protein